MFVYLATHIVCPDDYRDRYEIMEGVFSSLDLAKQTLDKGKLHEWELNPKGAWERYEGDDVLYLIVEFEVDTPIHSQAEVENTT